MILRYLLIMALPIAHADKYPNEVMDTPIVLCEQDHIVVKVKTTSSNPSQIYADDHVENPECSTKNKNILEIQHGKCGMSTERTEDPMGAIQRVCLNVQLHPLFVTESDRSYCVQCVYVEQHVLNEFEQTLAVSDATPSEIEPQFDFTAIPKCSYTIRKNSRTGPPAHYAAIGDRIFHVWQCDGGTHVSILVQNCYVEDGQGNRILIIDQNGCGVDQYVMDTPIYNDRRNIAYQETHVFKFAQKTVTRFACQMRICVQEDDCKDITPPRSCPTFEDRARKSKKLRDEPPPVLKPIYQSINKFERKLIEDSFGANATIGTVYFGAEEEDIRRRRQAATELPPPSLRVSRSGHPEMDVVGEIRVLESADDVRYFEHQQNRGWVDPCISGLVYSVLVTALILVSLLLLSLVLLLGYKNNVYKAKIERSEH